VGVAPEWRRQGLAARLLAVRVEWARPGDVDHEALITVAERDPLEPLDVALRAGIAREVLTRAGFDVASSGGALGAADPAAMRARRSVLPERMGA
jgi:GNAT superfamily N-acetyltransferase